jgi:hypothetical protein
MLRIRDILLRIRRQIRTSDKRIRIRNTGGKACASDLDPFVIRESGPDVVWLGDGGLVRLQDDLCPVVVHVQRSQDQDQPARTDYCLIFI